MRTMSSIEKIKKIYLRFEIRMIMRRYAGHAHSMGGGRINQMELSQVESFIDYIIVKVAMNSNLGDAENGEDVGRIIVGVSSIEIEELESPAYGELTQDDLRAIACTFAHFFCSESRGRRMRGPDGGWATPEKMKSFEQYAI